MWKNLFRIILIGILLSGCSSVKPKIEIVDQIEVQNLQTVEDVFNQVEYFGLQFNFRIF